MVNAKIATGAEQPINRHGGLAQYAGEEAELVGLDGSGDVVKADAASGSQVKARGVLLGPVDDPSNYPTEAVKLVVQSERRLVGEHRISYVEYGIVIENSDEDWGFTPGADVYLADGGGYTDSAPAGTGDLSQKVGYAIDDGNAIALHVDQSA